MLDAKFVIDSVARLKAVDSELALFGAKMHDYKLNPTLPLSEIEAFEQIYKVTLPADYRHYLLEIANGGAGPAYGVFKLGEIDENFGLGAWRENDGLVGVLAEPWPHSEAWNDLSGLPVEEDFEGIEQVDAAWEAFTERYWADHFVNGAIPICHEGCAIRDFLVANGNEAGNVWVDARSENGGIYPFSKDATKPTTFSNWYMNWLKAALHQFGLR